ncbi:MAG: GyrI-like domain-containing protein [Bacteroidota bacterium]|nr:GyrI-like domain-containing protein [Bacteroidota bacterium]
MQPRIEPFTEKKLLGKRVIMSLADNKTGKLWKSFMQCRKEIQNNIGTDLYSVQVYKNDYFEKFDPAAKFEKWATIEVTDFDNVPEGMQTFIIPAGLYAVFLYKGNSSKATETFQYIFGTWLPSSIYKLDTRPHFEVLGEKYKNGDPDSEEEIWIPIR